MPGWTSGEVSRPPPASLLLVCSGQIGALPLPPSRLPRRPPRRGALSPLHSLALLLPPQCSELGQQSVAALSRGRSAAAHHPNVPVMAGSFFSPMGGPSTADPGPALRGATPEARGPTLPNQCFPEPARRPSGGTPRWPLWTVPPPVLPRLRSRARAPSSQHSGRGKSPGAPSSPPSSPPPALCPGLKRRSERYANTKQIGKAGKKGKLE